MLAKTKASIQAVILPPPVVEALKGTKRLVSSRWMFPSSKKEDAPLAPAAVSHRLSKILTHAGRKVDTWGGPKAAAEKEQLRAENRAS